MADEDKRRAVEITVTLSSQLITAALAMLAIEGAYVAYALSERSVTSIFLWAAALSGLSFISSIFIAGKGITEARNSGFAGAWDIQVARRKFNWQAITLLIALLLFAGTAVLSGPTRHDQVNLVLLSLQGDLTELQTQVDGLADDIDAEQFETTTLISNLEALERLVTQMGESLQSDIAALRAQQQQDTP